MFDSITIGDIVTLVIGLSAFITAVIFLTKPVREIWNRLTRLERAIFDDTGMVRFTVRTEYDRLTENMTEIKDAVNIICDAMMVMLDSQLNGDNAEELKAAKTLLQRKRGIV